MSGAGKGHWHVGSTEWRDPDVERACAIDRAHFEAHRDQTVYYRAPLASEFDERVSEHVYILGDLTDCMLVRVDLLAPGVRLRTPIFIAFRKP